MTCQAHDQIDISMRHSEAMTERRSYLNCLLGWRPSSCMANKMRRCTGFNPSRTSGNALPTMTDIAYCIEVLHDN